MTVRRVTDLASLFSKNKRKGDELLKMENDHDIKVALEVLRELRRANDSFAPFHSAHEGMAILREEVDELWDDVKANDIQHARVEALQVAAMAMKFVITVCDSDGKGDLK